MTSDTVLHFRYAPDAEVASVHETAYGGGPLADISGLFGGDLEALRRRHEAQELLAWRNLPASEFSTLLDEWKRTGKQPSLTREATVETGGLDWISGKGASVGLLRSLGKALRKVVSSPIGSIAASFIPGGGLVSTLARGALGAAGGGGRAATAGALGQLLQKPTQLGKAGGVLSAALGRVKPGVGRVVKAGAAIAGAGLAGRFAAGGLPPQQTYIPAGPSGTPEVDVYFEGAKGYILGATSKKRRRKQTGRYATTRRRRRAPSRRISPRGGKRRYSKKQLANMRRFAAMARSRKRRKRRR